MKEEELDTIVIGAGPSGLAAASHLALNDVNVRLLEQGALIANRGHRVAADLAVGVGGAGLFSDGKFSYYPSGTSLYELEDTNVLQAAYSKCSRLLAHAKIPTEPFPNITNQVSSEGLKSYPSHYGTLEQRRHLIEILQNSIIRRIHPRTKVICLSRRGQRFAIDTIRPDRTTCTYVSDIVILATGRFGGLDVSEGRLATSIPLDRIRYEVGIRIETPSSIGFLNRAKSADVKRIWRIDDAEIRTFCTCRQGEIWNIDCGVLSAISGRSDGPPTRFSNFGLLARFVDPEADEVWSDVRKRLRHSSVTYQPIGDFISSDDVSTKHGISTDRPWFPPEQFVSGSIREQAGDRLHGVLARAVEELLEWSPDLYSNETMCLFPAIEGVGSYPKANAQLRVGDNKVFACGDVVGRFRGLIPALVSGFYAALRAQQELEKM